MTLEQKKGEKWQLTLFLNDGKSLTARQGEPLLFTARKVRAAVDWNRLPATGMSYDDAQAYVTWLRRTGRVREARLCDEREWERAARGADDRIYSHGNRLAPEDANFDMTYRRKPFAYGPDPVGSHPASESPFGLADTIGNVYELTESMWMKGEPIVRGGSWYYDSVTDLVANRTVVAPHTRDMGTGLRVCASIP